MKNKKGFTLVELLAVIVVLGILMTVAGVAAVKIKRENNIKQAKILENSLTNLGENIFSYEVMTDFDNKGTFIKEYKDLENNNTDKYIVKLGTLKRAGYIKDLIGDKISNPAGGTCDGYLEIKKENNAPIFKGYISCVNLYETDGYDSNYSSLKSATLSN